jgi:hypothetical protein
VSSGIYWVCRLLQHLSLNFFHIVVVGITKIFPDSSGTRVIMVDEKSDAFVYNPVIVVICQILVWGDRCDGMIKESICKMYFIFKSSLLRFNPGIPFMHIRR